MSFARNITMCFLMVLSISIFTPQASSAYDIDENVEVYDPIEPVNRAVYGFNRVLDKTLFSPVARTYRNIVPEYVRKRVHSVLVNLSEPVTLLNSGLQGDAENAHKAFWRFTINSTMGLGGLFDIAGIAGLKHRSEDFGQTMGSYGIHHGPYLMLPIFGPSNARDVVGSVADSLSDPFNYVMTDYAIAGRNLAAGIDKRESLLDILGEIDRVSLDPYAAVRSLYTQRRTSQIRNGE